MKNFSVRESGLVLLDVENYFYVEGYLNSAKVTSKGMEYSLYKIGSNGVGISKLGYRMSDVPVFRLEGGKLVCCRKDFPLEVSMSGIIRDKKGRKLGYIDEGYSVEVDDSISNRDLVFLLASYVLVKVSMRGL